MVGFGCVGVEGSELAANGVSEQHEEVVGRAQLQLLKATQRTGNEYQGLIKSCIMYKLMLYAVSITSDLVLE